MGWQHLTDLPEASRTRVSYFVDVVLYEIWQRRKRWAVIYLSKTELSLV